MKVLRENGFRATASIRDNRLKKCTVDSARTMAKYDRDVNINSRYEEAVDINRRINKGRRSAGLLQEC
ncbi:unnamed protein product [Acanthoscelides obtectus]|uniref:Uncharacterized protein n=1 Tax=Acanthoscelides obtectus TaxID=200917 RepID=A0A9P0LZA5_ACAOB|nr:unnamed protein product [Acanthoscelides obtectus]CAK1678398.1 hypothetical protein AOBTE_LOCUS31868 [Acanthoscelides obtectus]